MTEVLFRGEYVEESHANLILARESNPNTPEYKRRVEEQERKKQEQEQQKQQEQKQKRSESRLKEKKVEEYFHKYRQENYPPDVHYGNVRVTR
jgi:ABC-type glutathione transport system ATPase component